MSYRVIGDAIHNGHDNAAVEMTQVQPRTPDAENSKPKVSIPGPLPSDPDVVFEKTAHISLFQAAREGRKDIIEQRIIKLRRHAPSQLHRRLNKKDENKLTALHYAVRYGHIDVVKLLIKAGASVSIEGDDGATALHFAARFRTAALIRAKTSSTSRQVSLVDGGVSEGDVKSEEDVHRAVAAAVLNAEVITGEVSLSGAEVMVDDESIINYLMEKNADINCGDKYGLTPLHYACNKSNIIATRELLKWPGVEVDKMDKAGCTPLHCAANNGSVEVSQLLIEHGASLRATDEEYCTPLHYACMEGHLSVVKLLISAAKEKGGEAFVDQMIKDKDRENQSTLHVAVDSGYLDVVELLIENGADVNAVRNNLAVPLHLAAISGQLNIAKHLVDHGADIEARNSDHETPLHKAASYDRYEVASFLISKRANIDARDKDNFTPLLVSAMEGHNKIMKLLLAKGANLHSRDVKDRTAIFMAAEENCHETLKLLLEAPEANILINESDMYEDTPLHVAASKGYVGATAILLKFGARIDARNDEEYTPLHLAAKNGRTKTVRELLKGDPSIINDEDEASNTPLHHAAMEGHKKCALELLNHGAAVDARNARLWTPLDCAAAQGWSKTVNVLLDFDSPVDPTDKTKTTPLHLASKNGHVDVVTLLLSRNADISLLDHAGRNCLDLAIEYGRKEVALAIVQGENWEMALKNKTIGEDGNATTPLRKLIKRLPDVAEVVLSQCVEDNKYALDHADYKVTLNYEFLEDIYMDWDASDNEKDNISLSSESITQSEYEEKIMNQRKIMSLLEQKKSHPLMVMVRSKRVDLLGHPLVVFLLNNKWRKYGRYVYYSKLVIYCIFLLFLTGYVVYATENTQILGSAVANCSLKYRNPDTTAHRLWIGFGRYVILILTCLHLVLELVQAFYQRKHYLTFENLMEWATYLLAIVYVSNDIESEIFQGLRTTPCGDWRQSIGAVAIFMAWMNLVLFIRKFPMLGIYVVMFTDILITFSRLFLIFVLFIISFSLSFFALLYVNGDKTPGFRTPFRAIMKSSVMMIGEFDFDNIFNDSNVKVPAVTWALFAVFVIIMTLLLMNLLIGLAVDDIKGVQDQAVLKRQAMQVDLALDVEKALPRAIRKEFVSKRDELKLNELSKGIFSWFTKPPVSSEEVKEKTSPVQTDMKRLESQNSEMKKSMNQLKTKIKEMKAQQDQLQTMLKAVVDKLDVLVDDAEEDEEDF